MRTECSEKAVGLDLILVLSTGCLCSLNLSLRVHNQIRLTKLEKKMTPVVQDPDPLKYHPDPEIRGGGGGRWRSVSKNFSPFGPQFGLKTRGALP